MIGRFLWFQSGSVSLRYHNRLADYVGVQFGSLPKILIAVLCWNFTVDMEAASRGFDFALGGWATQ